MKEDATILGDRETVELLSAHPELLAIADAVRATQREQARAWRPRVRLLLAAAVVAGLATVGAFALAGSSGGQESRQAVEPAHLLVHFPTALTGHLSSIDAGCSLLARDGCSHSGVNYGYAPVPDRFDDTITRTGGAISSIAVTVRSELFDSTAHLRVYMEGIHSTGAGRVVFSEHVPLASVPSPPVWGAVSAWSGTLSPSDWDGGCQDAVYWLQVDEPNPGGMTVIQSPPFDCRRVAVGPTGRGGSTGG